MFPNCLKHQFEKDFEKNLGATRELFSREYSVYSEKIRAIKYGIKYIFKIDWTHKIYQMRFNIWNLAQNNDKIIVQKFLPKRNLSQIFVESVTRKIPKKNLTISKAPKRTNFTNDFENP